jgi:hypothetical protein
LRLELVSQASVELGGERIWNMPRSNEPAKEIVMVGWWWQVAGERKSSGTCTVRVRKNCLAAPSGLSVEAAAFKWLELGTSENEKEGDGKSEE